MIDLIGYAAGILGMISFIPQLIKTYKTKQANDISMAMLWLFMLTNALYIIYGIALSLTPVVITLLLSTVIVIGQMILTVKYSTKEKEQADAITK